METLELDLVGPSPQSKLAEEILKTSPLKWYLTGFLAPRMQAVTEFSREGAEPLAEDLASEAQDVALRRAGPSDETEDNEPAASQRRAAYATSIGLSVLVPASARSVQVTATWGDYSRVAAETVGVEVEAHEDDEGEGEDEIDSSQKRKAFVWRRIPFTWSASLSSEDLKASLDREIEGARGIRLVTRSRAFVAPKGLEHTLSEPCFIVRFFLVNDREVVAGVKSAEAFAFQARLDLTCDTGFLLRPNLRGYLSADEDERLANLHFRDAHEFAVGHGVATSTGRTNGGPDTTARALEVYTSWMPRAEIPRIESVDPAGSGTLLQMETLAGVASFEQAAALLTPFLDDYARWQREQSSTLESLPREQKDTGRELLDACALAELRMRSGLQALKDPHVLRAFALTNKAMALASRKQRPLDTRPPTWRSFQLAFLLLNLDGIASPHHSDRENVDLIYFPTGGGKTEAYLGLAAFTLLLRRLRNPHTESLRGLGTTVLMRYTLRLLTIDQLGRALTLMCALEHIRRSDEAAFGPWPFEVGLWMGQSATPNRMGTPTNAPDGSAVKLMQDYALDSGRPRPIPLERCPWCKGSLNGGGVFRLRPSAERPLDLRLRCPNDSCDYSNHDIPLVAVDEAIYRRLPCFVIATLDKVAALPWVAGAGALFGHVAAHCENEEGFVPVGEPLPRGATLIPEPDRPLPPELIIQDELHLISGPLGTMAGLFETAIDSLCRSHPARRDVSTKIVASTATVRKARDQMRALFGRRDATIFPPPGPSRHDTYFSRTAAMTEDNPGRLYMGLATPGRGPKPAMRRLYTALLSAGEAAGADGYRTLLGYFNSLRELGGARRIVEDEVYTSLATFGRERNRSETHERPRLVDRIVRMEVKELTSRVSTVEVSKTKDQLNQEFKGSDSEGVPVALATNMISVGLDIPRLGLMVVQGQPKTSAEYIQTTSRVGRDPARAPGLVITQLNLTKPRDRSHYERFEGFHAGFYRGVEAASVTPFASRTLERGLAAVVVTLVRHSFPSLTPDDAAKHIDSLSLVEKESLATLLSERSRTVGAKVDGEILPPPEDVRRMVLALLDAWVVFVREAGVGGYVKGASGKALLRDPLDPSLTSSDPSGFAVGRSLRDVESTVALWIKK